VKKCLPKICTLAHSRTRVLPSNLHIISFDVPFPPDYGGVIDVYFKIKALAEAGVKVHLHCFEYGRVPRPELALLCENVYYYQRQMSKRHLMSALPYIVITRRSELLMKRLLEDNYPILFEGLHSCFHLNDARLSGRKKLVRTHNIEHTYYYNLAQIEKRLFRRMYYRQEAAKLKQFEKNLAIADGILAISLADEKELRTRYSNVTHVSAFHSNEEVGIRPGQGKFVLYHGNLEVGENNEAALYLVEKVMAGSKIPLIIAGKKPSRALRAAVALYPSVQLKDNIPTEEIHELIQDAQVNVLPTFQATGIKLKLLAALYMGRHCVVNTPMVQCTGLEKLCSVCDTPAQMRAEIERLYTIPFEGKELENRKNILTGDFSNKENIKKLIRLI
jgi:glycosyltransferase involved in cell wall biosynthesis